MRKTKLLIGVIILCCLSAFSSALDDCKNRLKGIWKGDLGHITNVSLNLHMEGGFWGDAGISFIQDGARVSFDFLRLTSCVINPANNRISMKLHRNQFGGVSDMEAELINEYRMEVKNFSYSMGGMSGRFRGLDNYLFR